MNEMLIPRMATIQATAEMFGLSTYFVRQKVRSGEVIAVKTGCKYLVNVDKFADYLNSNILQNDEPQRAKAHSIQPIPVDM